MGGNRNRLPICSQVACLVQLIFPLKFLIFRNIFGFNMESGVRWSSEIFSLEVETRVSADAVQKQALNKIKLKFGNKILQDSSSRI